MAAAVTIAAEPESANSQKQKGAAQGCPFEQVPGIDQPNRRIAIIEPSSIISTRASMP